LDEAGADVELVLRADTVRWLTGPTWWKSERNPLKILMYATPRTDVGPPVLNQIVSRPGLFKAFPLEFQRRMAARSIRPAGARWLVDRVRGVRVTTGRTVVSAKPQGNQLCVMLDDSTTRSIDHVLLGTGYRIDITRYSFLSPGLLSLQCVNGYPQLAAGFESSVPGLHFLGAPAAWSFGPLMRFVAGTRYSARELVRVVLAADGRHLSSKKYAWTAVGSQ